MCVYRAMLLILRTWLVAMRLLSLNRFHREQIIYATQPSYLLMCPTTGKITPYPHQQGYSVNPLRGSDPRSNRGVVIQYRVLIAKQYNHMGLL